MIQRPSPNYGQRLSSVIDMLVIHYTGMTSAEEALSRLCDEASQVSSHYLIDEDGSIFCLVPEEHRAWHAGRSFWRGETDINSRSIGIELVNPGHEFGYRAFPDAQIDALIQLSLGIVKRHPIPPRNVVGHSDIAPSRKQDPGELFPWRHLASNGLGVWPEDKSLPKDDLMSNLSLWGYDIKDEATSISAFQRHFRPSRIDGIIDSETQAIAQSLITQFV